MTTHTGSPPTLRFDNNDQNALGEGLRCANTELLRRTELNWIDLPHAVSCRGHRRCTQAPLQRYVSIVWWCLCGNWCSTGRLGGMLTAEGTKGMIRYIRNLIGKTHRSSIGYIIFLE